MFLQGRLADARAGSGHVLLVCGPAGIGKTRLIEELAASADGMQIGWGGAVDDAGMPPLWPWVRAVRDFPAPRTAVASVTAGAAQREYSSAEDTVAATFTADTGVVDALAEQSRAGPGLLVVLDDLPWADGATLRLLERIASEARAVRGTGKSRTARIQGHKGGIPVSSTAPPQPICIPPEAAASSSTRRVLPIPAGPQTRTT